MWGERRDNSASYVKNKVLDIGTQLYFSLGEERKLAEQEVLLASLGKAVACHLLTSTAEAWYVSIQCHTSEKCIMDIRKTKNTLWCLGVERNVTGIGGEKDESQGIFHIISLCHAEASESPAVW